MSVVNSSCSSSLSHTHTHIHTQKGKTSNNSSHSFYPCPRTRVPEYQSHLYRYLPEQESTFLFVQKRLCFPQPLFHTHRLLDSTISGPDFDPKIYAFLNNPAFPLILTTGKSRSSIPSLIAAGEYFSCPVLGSGLLSHPSKLQDRLRIYDDTLIDTLALWNPSTIHPLLAQVRSSVCGFMLTMTYQLPTFFFSST